MECGQAAAQSDGGAEEPDFGSSQPAGNFLTSHVPGASRVVEDDRTCRSQLLFLSCQLSWGSAGNMDRGHTGGTDQPNEAVYESQTALPLLS